MLDILYEDKDLIVCVKPYGVLSQPDSLCSESMLSLISEHLIKKGEKPYVEPVQRLDRGTSGVIVFSKNQRITGKLSAIIANRELCKEYLAVISGVPSQAEGKYTDYIYKDSRQNKSFVCDKDKTGAKEAILEYKLIKSVCVNGNELSLVKIVLHTGRTHQIRVQFSHRNMPLAGDGKYGSKIRNLYPALFSQSISFSHPANGKTLHFTANPPNDFPWNLFVI